MKLYHFGLKSYTLKGIQIIIIQLILFVMRNYEILGTTLDFLQ